MTSDKPTIQDPNIKPPGYKPPTSAEELVERYIAGERYFVGAKLESVGFNGANLEGANLANADLREANFQGCSLQGTVLTDAVMLGAVLDDNNGTPASLAGCKVTLGNRWVGRWGIDKILLWSRLGADFVDGEELPPEERALLHSNPEGLTLYFNTSLAPFDRFLVDYVIYVTLGKDTACQVEEFRNDGDTAIVRLVAERQEDLEEVAEALHQRVWEQQAKTADGERRAIIQQIGFALPVEQVGGQLSKLVSLIKKMEFWLSDKDIAEYLEDTAKANRQKKDKATVTPAEVKAAKAGLKMVRKWVMGEAGKLVEDGVKGLLSGTGEEGEE
jgi:hypothetical protein